MEETVPDFQKIESQETTALDYVATNPEKTSDSQNSTVITDLPDNETTHRSADYRPDIDGLRAVAVSIVVIFHAWPQFLTGGFIGVDVFFVISGYFITRILIKQKMSNSFSYFNFYSRRVKRIYPALIVVLLFVLWLAIRYSDLEHLQMIAKTMAASTVFGANIEILTYKQGYWDADVKTNPLLHLWSLGVEQQFYIFWPFLISLLLTKFQSKSLHILSAFTVLSFIFNVIAVSYDSKFDFYFPFCRFWQMAIGGLLAANIIKVKNTLYAHVLSTIGLITIFTASYFLSEANLYPGGWALFPTLASAAIIVAGESSIANKYILGNRLMVFLGKISYSLYLWHWPMLVLSRTFFPEGSEQLLGQTWFTVLLSVVFSVISYFLVENPIRFTKKKLVFFILLLVMLLIGVASVFVYKNAQTIKREDNFDIEFPDEPIQPEIIDKDSNKQEEKNINQRNQNSKNETNPQKKQKETNKAIDQSVQPVQPQPEKPKHIETDLEQYQRQIIPTPQDYYLKEGKMIPNWSKNKNRIPPTVKKLKFGEEKKYFEENILFDKRIDINSKYYEPKLPNNSKLFAVSNEGQDKLVLLYGDSHAHYTAFRFGKLYEDAKNKNRTHELPTFVAMLSQGSQLTIYEDNYNFLHDWVKKHKPDRVMLIYFWPHYRVYHGFQNFWRYYSGARDQYFYENVGYFIKAVQNFTEQGVQVFTNNFQPYGDFYWPQKMYGINGIVQKSVQPVKLSEVNSTYIHLANYLYEQATKAGAKVINYTDHSCWEDTCHLVTPNGYAVYSDFGHWVYEVSRNWLTSVDFLIQFGKEEGVGGN